ncbi:MAG: efflux RND transporter periplasmic adaptor subunit [Phycisphaerales bacterium JB039]
MWKWILGLVILLGAVIGAFQLLGARMPVATAEARAGAIEAYVDERATTRVPDVLIVAPPMAGRVGPALVREGDFVEAGQVVAHMATDDLQRTLDAAAARLAEAEARIVEHDDNRIEELLLEQAETFTEVMDRVRDASEQQTRASAAALELATEERQRIAQAMEAGSSTEFELLRARTAEVQSEAAAREDEIILRASEAMLVAARIGPQVVRRYIDRKTLTRVTLVEQRDAAAAELAQAQADLDRAALRAPVDGVVLRADHVSERYVAPGTPIVEIGRLADLEVEAEILTEQASAIEVGQFAALYGGALGDVRIGGLVTRIYPQGFEERSALGVQQQRVLVIARPAPDLAADARQAWDRLGAGYRVRVRIRTARTDEAIIVPRAAVFPLADGGSAVFRIEGGRARQIAVETGLSNDEQAEITAGLAAGDTVIVAPPADLRDGARVRPAL